eukprot:CAMPEP_0175370756 /NCGR_PEP_ID=MMETSP0095-20121207/21370_1 /TAXON_ID=311494 /ORGANISM="Alexandrium monilatum, Strain CCMP3105" /LENGTH=65 /DNA_ID=CAMNT_0016668911 /DNA_START=556 /DNA_END=750 /DNA_ORIENTATION=+
MNSRRMGLRGFVPLTGPAKMDHSRTMPAGRSRKQPQAAQGRQSPSAPGRSMQGRRHGGGGLRRLA